jgi:hypothetical protein
VPKPGYVKTGAPGFVIVPRRGGSGRLVEYGFTMVDIKYNYKQSLR